MSSSVMGRPSLYKPEYCEMLLEHMEQGFSLESFAGKLRVSRETLYEWMRVHADFSDTVKIAKGLSQYKWEELGREMMMGRAPGSVPSLYMFNMKNRFGWADQPKESDDDKNKSRQIVLNYDPKKKLKADE